ncbi:MAG: ATPase [Kiritimatiellae bacterium]|nr:ATPase [Kiritimatiellia bacterium]
MAEELQGLLERIQKDAVEKAQTQADELIAKAKEKSAALVKEAEEKAAQSLAKADTDAQAFAERSKKTLEQAARDLLITVGRGVESLFASMVRESVDQAMSGDVIAGLLGKLCEGGMQDQELTVSVNEQDQEAVVKFFNAKFAEAMKNGQVTIQTDNEIIKGFTVGLKGQDVYTDFTDEAVAEALMKFLRPQLAEIVGNVTAGRK